MPDEAGIGNPVDMIASATAEQYGRVLELLCRDPNVDSVIVIFIPPLVTKAEDVAAALMEAVDKIEDTTLLACFLGVRGVHEALRVEGKVVPSYAFPESAACALGKAAAYGAWCSTPEGKVPVLEDVDRVGAAQLVAEALQSGEGWLDPGAVTSLLDHYGIRSVRTRIATTPEEVAKVAADLGSRVAVKIASRKIVHKTDVGGVRLDLKSPEQAAAAAAEILDGLRAQDLADQIDGFIVQEMVSGEGAEMFVGMTHDPSFGPLVACGAGGTLVELLRDVSVRITPLTDVDVKEMLRSLKTWPLFEGYRGRPPLDASGLEDLLLRVSTMVEDLPQLIELDLNPVHVSPDGCTVLDARMKLGTPTPPSPRGARTKPRS